MKELLINFVGKGQVRGFIFTQIKKSESAYIYEVNVTEDQKHYEVFKKRENSKYKCVSYPSDKAFGKWAWTYSSLDKALNKFEELNEKSI